MKNKTQKSEKTITFYRKKNQPLLKRVLFFKNLQRERSHKTVQRILGRLTAYSLDTLWGTLTDKLFREPPKNLPEAFPEYPEIANKPVS